MKKTLTALAVLAPLQASAAWQLVLDRPDYALYIDPATVVREGDVRRFSEMQSFKQRNNLGVFSLRLQVEFNCDDNQPASRTLQSRSFSEEMGRGQTMSSLDTPGARWAPINRVLAPIVPVVCTK